VSLVGKHTTVIGGHEYVCETFPASEGLVLLPKLLALLGDDVAKLVFSTSEEQQAQIFGSADLLAGILVRVSERAAENNGLLLVRDCFARTKCTTGKVGDAVVEIDLGDVRRFDSHFAGKYGHLFEVFAWIVRLSFGSP
jgi:hypothetical protein